MLTDESPASGGLEGEPGSVATRKVWRTVAVPSEHGGWGLTAEPILLGLLLAFSWTGVAVGAAAFLAFLVRTPLKLALGDRRRQRSLPRTVLAWRFALAELMAIGALAAVAVTVSGWDWLIPVAVAVPLVAVELWYDIRSHSRRLVPELFGAVGIASVVAAIVVAGGGATELAVAAWLILAGRGMTSVPFVRTQIRRLRCRGTALSATDVFQAVGAFIALSALVAERSVVFGSASVVVLAVAQVVWLRRPIAPIGVIGIRQMIFGFGIVGATAASVAAMA